MSSTIDNNGLYKLVIVGGGPAGIGVFIRAARTGYLPRLLDPERHGTMQDLTLSSRCGMTQKGVAVLHDGDASSFGSGNLGSYLINSNTFAKSLVASVLDEKPELDPPESVKHTFLEHVRTHESAQRLENIGLAPASLIEMGNFLKCIGTGVAAELAQHAATSTCLLTTRATRFDVLESGVIRVEAVRGDGETIVLHTEHVALAMGGKQEVPPGADNPALAAKTFTSETVLREAGFAQLREHLLRAPDRKVCIVGGSHSSFSVAWMLLNRFHSKLTIRTGVSVTKAKTGGIVIAPPQLEAGPVVTDIVAEPLPVKEPIITVDSISSSNSSSPTKKSAQPVLNELVITPVTLEPLGLSVATAPATPTTPTSSSMVSPAVVGTVAKCESVKKPLKVESVAIFKPKDITILHRTPIRCYYGSKKEAEADGADSSRVDRAGCINTFTGLREDSKNLFKDVKAGRETRVRLFQVNPHGCQSLTAKAYESASAIVWCCGYKTRMIPGFDARGERIAFYEENGVVKLDLHARLQTLSPPQSSPVSTATVDSKDALEPFPNVFGLGLGFSMRSAVDEMGSETRADGVTVYHRRGATIVLAAMFGTDVFGSDAKSFEEMVEKNDKKKQPTTMKIDAAAPATGAAASPSNAAIGERVKRPSKLVVTNTPTPSKSKVADSTTPSSSNTPSKVTLTLQPPGKSSVATSSSPTKRRTPVAKPLGGGNSSSGVRANNYEHAPATNPPVKLLLERRRSVDAMLHMTSGTKSVTVLLKETISSPLASTTQQTQVKDIDTLATIAAAIEPQCEL